MKKTSLLILLFLPIFAIIIMGLSKPRKSAEITLQKWFIQSSDSVNAGGKVISSANFIADNWYPARVPSTVLGSLVHDHLFGNIFFAKNLKNISEKLFKASWWYRTKFKIPENLTPENTVQLIFNGLNYRANIWLNGHKIASSDTTEGSFSRFKMEVNNTANVGGMNYLAVEVYRPEAGEPRLGFVDWNPTPPDHDMGIWRNVRVKLSGPVTISQPFVKSDVNTTTLDHADLTVSAKVKNHSASKKTGTLTGQIENRTFSKEITLPPGASKVVSFKAANYPQLQVEHPRLWWTHELGSPELYHLDFSFEIGKKLSDQKTDTFGIREITDYITEQGHRGFKLNGQKVLIKGGGWTDPMLLNNSPDKLKAQIEYAKHMNLNTLRLEGFWGSGSELYDLCDKNGLLLMIGYSAQWEWQHSYGSKADKYGAIQSSHDINLAADMFRDQVIWLRNHPSIFLWLYGSDKVPRPRLEKKYLKTLKAFDPTRPHVAAAKEHDSKITGPTRMKMRGPYDYVPPSYWYVDNQYGGAFGFNTETGPGPVIPPVEGLKKFIPADSLWPINDIWLYHSSRGRFRSLKRYNTAMDKRLGRPTSLKDYERKAQYMNYEGLRAMFEAFEAHRFRATGVIQWMYNSAWPKLWWQLFGYYLIPTGGFYGTKKACEPLHIQYNYQTNAIDLINNTLQRKNGLKARIRVFDSNMSKRLDKTTDVNISLNNSKAVFRLPEFKNLSKTYFLDLRLFDNTGKQISINFYALSTQKDLLQPDKSTWYVTPQKQFAKKTLLDDLPLVHLHESHKFKSGKKKLHFQITLTNSSNKLAFMVHPTLIRAEDKQMVVPVFWDDNYVTLLPGEHRTIKGYCLKKDLNNQNPQIGLSGWNIKN